jgi:hypothetical protein
MLSRDLFIQVVRDDLSLPLADPRLEDHFDQPVSWRSVQRVRLLSRLEKVTGIRPALDQFFAAPTTTAVFNLYQTPSPDH